MLLFLLCVFPWSLPRVGNGDSQRKDVTPGHPGDEGSNTGKTVRLTRKTFPSLLVLTSRIQGIQCRGDGNDCALLPPEWEVRWASLAIFFLDLELDDSGHWGRLEVFFFRLVSPAEGVSALALAHFS